MRLFLTLIVLFFLSSCFQTNEEAGFEMNENKRKERLNTISTLEKDFGATEMMDMNKGSQLIKAYENYANEHRNDSLAPVYLFKAADLSIGLKKYQEAIILYERIFKYYHEFPKRSDALFMQAFVYDEHLKIKGKASDLYDQMIEKYPDHPLADDAASLKEKLTLTDEELIKLFEEKNKQNAVVQK